MARNVGVVVIGKNEGVRLHRSLASIHKQSLPTVYVDSGSSDGSVAFAKQLGCEVIELNMERPFTAARARNTGARRLLSANSQLEYVQFIDGDCEMDSDWIDAALAQMAKVPNAAAVGGRCREKFPNATIYNRIIDAEWDTEVGEAKACGGNVLLRAEAFLDVGGFDEAFAAGEEPEMCLRLRERGWTIWRIDAEMVLHDADITAWKQWWQRSKRSGVAFAQGAWTHGGNAERYNVRDCARIWFWAGALPLGAVALNPVTAGASSLGAVGGYGILLTKLIRERLSKGDPLRIATAHALFNLGAKFPQLQGQIEFLRRRKSAVIDHRNAGTLWD